MIRVALAVLLLTAGCLGNPLRSTFRPVPLQGQTSAQLDADDAACRAIGYRAGQGLHAGLGDTNAMSGSLIGYGAGGTSGQGIGLGAGLAVDTASDIQRRGRLMHAAYQACMRDRGYQGTPRN